MADCLPVEDAGCNVLPEWMSQSVEREFESYVTRTSMKQAKLGALQDGYCSKERQIANAEKAIADALSQKLVTLAFHPIDGREYYRRSKVSHVKSTWRQRKQRKATWPSRQF